MRTRAFGPVLGLCLSFPGGLAWPAEPGATVARGPSYGRIPLHFEPNQGQAREHVQFLSRGAGYGLFLSSNEAVLALRGDARSAVVRLRLVGASPAAEPAGVEELQGRSHYFRGNDPQEWRTNVPHYARVRYAAVYPGIDLVYYGNQRQLEYDFVVAPGADPGRIRMKVEGASSLRLDTGGNLVLTTRGGELVQKAPVIYQETPEGRTLVPGGYTLGRGRHVRFQVGAYDRTRPLVIDPVLVYSTFLGGNSGDYGNAVAADAAGNAYVTGSTYSTNFPTVGAFQGIKQSNPWEDVFVTKLNAAGSAFVYSTYLGGNDSEVGNAIAVDGAGNAYVTGRTSSSNFPVTAGAVDMVFGGGAPAPDVFVTKLNPAGSGLVYSTYLSLGAISTGWDEGNGIAVDVGGNAYVTGEVRIVSTLDTAALAAKLNPAGSALLYYVALTGSGTDIGKGIAVDASGNAYIAGGTTATDFPTVNPIQGPGMPAGAGDAFVSKLNAAGDDLIYSTYLGGGLGEKAFGIALDSSGNAYVAGETTSDDFPLVNPLYAVHRGGADGFVAKLNAAGSALVYSTFLGGTGNDYASGIAVDASRNAYVAGYTTSPDFPTANAFQPALGVGNDPDAFVTKLNAAGSALVYSTYLGGSDLDVDQPTGSDWANGIAVDTSGNAYVVGRTQAANFPTASPLQPIKNAAIDTFVTKLDCTTGGGPDIDEDGIPNGVEPAEGRNPCRKDNDIFTSARLFAMQQYRDFVKREGDSGGIQFWTAAINGGTSRATVTKSFFDSPEFQGAIAPVGRLYFAYFNRIPDKAGFDYWSAAYGSGTSLNTISQAFAQSPEFIATYGSLSNSAFVTLVYNNVLNRPPDAGGLAYWTGQLNGGMTRGQVMVGFSESAEYQASSYNRVFVTMTYYGMLRRMPDQPGFDYWVGYFNGGASALDLINGFLISSEYRARFLP